MNLSAAPKPIHPAEFFVPIAEQASDIEKPFCTYFLFIVVSVSISIADLCSSHCLEQFKQPF